MQAPAGNPLYLLGVILSEKSLGVLRTFGAELRKTVAHSGREHQQKDWKSHKGACKGKTTS